MREIVFDTYSGEGRIVQDHEDFPNFRHWYIKASEGEFGFIGPGNQPVDDVTIHNFRVAHHKREQGKLDTLAAYHYARRHDEGFHWQDQAETYMRQVDWLDAQGVQLDYDVLDLEPANNATDHPVHHFWRFPKDWGAWMKEWYKFVTQRTGRKCLIYSGPYAAFDMFDRWGYEWHRECDWIISAYPFDSGPWNDQFYEDVLAGHHMPFLGPIEYLRDKVVMWQFSEKYPVTGWQLDEEGGPGSHAADVNVWLVEWREFLDKPLPELPDISALKRAINRMRLRIQPFTK